MSVSFKDYVIISDAFRELELQEGAVDDIWEFVKNKFKGKKMSPTEMQDEVDRLKKTNVGVMKNIQSKAQEKASREFELRKTSRKTIGAQPTRGQSNDVWDSARGFDRRVSEETLAEAKEYSVEYTRVGGGAKKITKIKASDVAAVREKFKRDFHGMKLLTVSPARVLKTDENQQLMNRSTG